MEFAGQSCLNVGNGNGLPNFGDHGNDDVTRIRLHHQAIIPSYKFTCQCGNITEWGVDVEPDGGMDDREYYTLDFQVWRPSPTVGQYILIGNNRFTSISLNGGVAQVSVMTQNQIQFQSRDVLGFYVEEARDSNKGVNVVTTTSYTSETVWYASVATLNSIGCPISAGSSGVLNTQLRGAPVVSIETGKRYYIL